MPSLDPTARLSLLLRAFVDEDEDEVCDQLDALREAAADHGRFPNVDRALAAFNAENAQLEAADDGDSTDGDEAWAASPYEDD
jgi:hypothetical protein